MIHGLYANKESFHSVEFVPGLNVVLADRTEKSTQKDTRNGLGKSTLIEIIDYCLGSSGKELRQIEELIDWEFTLDLTVAGNRVKVTRGFKAYNTLAVDGSTDGWIEEPNVDKETGRRVLNVDNWRTILGRWYFGLTPSEGVSKYAPSFRSLVSYFVRQGSGAYLNPFSHFSKQKSIDIQLNVGLLLGLDWKYASKWQELKDQDRVLKAVSDAMKSGAIGHIWGSVGELETQLVQLESQVDRERDALATFRVHPQYLAIQVDADRLTTTIHELANQNVTDRQKFQRYSESISMEQAPSEVTLEQLYRETGIVFSNSIKKTLEEAREFHKTIIHNRAAFLHREIDRIKDRINAREIEIKKLSDMRSESLSILRTHGALEEMSRLQERHIEDKAHLEQVRARLKDIREANSNRRRIKLAKSELVKIAEQDHSERRESWARCVNLFAEDTQALYEIPGSLVINITENGYKFDIEIERSGSEGIGKMKVFCFDLMLLQCAAIQRWGIDFLIHDSILFDGVDSRQRALAIEHASKVSDDLGVQYICTMNSDTVPESDFSPGFNFNQYVRLRLTDKDLSGNLLGLQFERRSTD